MVTIKKFDLDLAFDWVSGAPEGQNFAYVSLDTGAIYWVSEFNDTEDEVPDDLEDSDRYISIPHKNELDLGSSLVFRFVDEELPEQRHRVADIFHHRGAYARFKHLLAAHHALEKWYAYE